MRPIPVKNSVLLKIEQALIDEISTESGFKLYLAPEYNFEENVAISGRITQLPKNYSKSLSVGDEVTFSYHTVSDRAFPNTSDHFVPISEGSKWIKIFQNSKGEKIRMMAHNGAISIFWTGVFFDKNGQFIPELSTRGTEEQVERWASQHFKFGNCENFVYRNRITMDGQEYWKCPLDNIFAKKVNDEIISVGDRVICEIIDAPIEPQLFKHLKLEIPDSAIQLRFYDRGKVITGGEEIGLKKGDVISFESKYCEKYKLWGKDYFIIKQRRVQGIWEDE